MSYTVKQGLRLRDGDISRHQRPGWLTRAVWGWGSSALLTLGGLTLTGYTAPYALAGGVLFPLLYCAAFAFLDRIGKSRWFFTVLPGVLLAVSLPAGTLTAGGFSLLWNRLSDMFLLRTGSVLPLFQTHLSAGALSAGVCLVLLLAAGYLSCLTCAVACVRPAALGAVVGMGYLFPMAFLRSGFTPLALAALCWALLLLGSSGFEKKRSPLALLSAWCACALFAGALLGIASLPALRQGAADLSESIRQSVHEKRYETKYTTLPEGDFDGYVPEQKPVRALSVTMDTPEEMYFRGFTGATFRNGCWEPLENLQLLKNRDLLYWLNLNAFDPDWQFSQAAVQAGLGTNTVTVQNTGACRSLRYVPFSLCPGAFSRPEELSDRGVSSPGEKVYSYTCFTGGAESVARVIAHLQTSTDPDVLEYRRAESAYRAFVSENYVHIPQEAMDLLAFSWESTARNFGGGKTLTQEQKRQCALVFLSQCFPDGTPAEGLELPLDHIRGSSYQYATVAVLTLRYFGIPARYAEGYILTRQAAADAVSGESIALDSSCAGAWPEVYQDGIGWIPMDMTPGLSEKIQHMPDDTLSSDLGQKENQEDPEESEQEQPEDDPSQLPDPSGGSRVTLLKKTAFGALLLLLFLLAAVLFLRLRRKKLLRRRQALYRDADVAASCGIVFADTVLLLSLMGLDPGNGSPRRLLEPCRERFGDAYAQVFAAAIDINHRALFSPHPLPEEDRALQLRLREMTLAQISAQLKRHKTFWLKWGRCLY